MKPESCYASCLLNTSQGYLSQGGPENGLGFPDLFLRKQASFQMSPCLPLTSLLPHFLELGRRAKRATGTEEASC